MTVEAVSYLRFPGCNLHQPEQRSSPWGSGKLCDCARTARREAVEPFLSIGASHVVENDNGWTLETLDGSLAAQYEHMIVITQAYPLVITAL